MNILSNSMTFLPHYLEDGLEQILTWLSKSNARKCRNTSWLARSTKPFNLSFIYLASMYHLSIIFLSNIKPSLHHCGSAWTELKMWCVIVVNRGLTTRVKGEQTVCTVRSLSQEWNGRSDRQCVLSTYCSVTVPLSLGDRSDNQNMYAQCVRVDEWCEVW